MRKIITLVLIFVIILFAGCTEIDLNKVSDNDLERISDKAVVCNEPYIRFGTTCCLDSNSNGICDIDEKNTENSSTNVEEDQQNNSTEFKEEKLNLFVEEGTNKFILNDKEYSFEVQNILHNGLYKVKLNGIEKSIIEPYTQIEFNGLYIILKDSVESARDSVKSYAELVVSNYDYELQPNEVSCFKNDNGIDRKKLGTTYGLSKDLSKVLIKEDVCKDSKNLIEYHCGDNEEIVSYEESCEFGCENGRCLSIADVGCNKAKLNSGSIKLIEGEEIKINTTSIKVISISEDFAELKINGNTKYLEMCDKRTYNDLTILIHDTIPSARESVKGYLELSYDYEPEENIKDDNTQENKTNENPSSSTIVLSDYEETTLNLGSETYTIKAININQQRASISVNGVSKEISVYSGSYIGDTYVYLNDLVYSSRSSVKSYIELIVSLQEVQGNFFCSDTGSNVIGYSDNTFSSIVSKADSCIDESSRKNYFCANDKKTILSSTETCPYGCSNGKCKVCQVESGKGLENTFVIGEGNTEVIIVGEHTYTFTAQSITDSKALLQYNYGSTSSYDSCESFEKGDVKFQINSIVTSSREGVKNYVEIGYEGISSYQLTDEFNFGEDTTSHNYETFNYTTSGAYTCETNTLRVGSCSNWGQTSSVSIELDVTPNSDNIKLSIQEATASNSEYKFDISIDGVSYGKFANIGPACSYTNLEFSNMKDYTSDGKITLKITDPYPTSCQGDPQLAYLKVYSK